MRARFWLAAGISAATLLAGCTVGPNYRAPGTEGFPAGFDVDRPSGPATRPSRRPEPDVTRWWTSLQDPEIDSLVGRAVRSNLDVGIALNRLQEARAGEYVVTGGMLPLVDVTAGAGRGTGSDSTRSRVGGPLHSGADTAGYREITEVAGFDATWELDVFGRFRRQIEAARADAQAAAEARRYVLTSVVADVVRAYIDERASELRLAVALQNLDTQLQTVQLVQARFNNGLTNELDVALARRQLASVRSEISPLRAAVAEYQRRLSVLLGEMPGRISIELQRPANLPDPPQRIRAGLPVELLRRRPDVRQAERELAASNARLGVATADLFPRVALVGSFGFQGQGLGRTPDMAKEIWSFGPSAYWPVLDFGSLDALVEVQDFRTRERLLAYRKTVLLAVEEVDNAIAAYDAQRDRLDQLNAAVDASRRAVSLATQRYERGLTDFLNVLDAQRQLFDLQDQQAIAQDAVAVQFVAIYKALGGGWEPFDSVPAIRQPRPAVLAAFQDALNPSTDQPLAPAPKR